jgi:hypothetical protein
VQSAGIDQQLEKLEEYREQRDAARIEAQDQKEKRKADKGFEEQRYVHACLHFVCGYTDALSGASVFLFYSKALG